MLESKNTNTKIQNAVLYTVNAIYWLTIEWDNDW